MPKGSFGPDEACRFFAGAVVVVVVVAEAVGGKYWSYCC